MLLASAKSVVGSRFVGWIERIYPPQITRVAIRYWKQSVVETSQHSSSWHLGYFGYVKSIWVRLLWLDLHSKSKKCMPTKAYHCMHVYSNYASIFLPVILFVCLRPLPCFWWEKNVKTIAIAAGSGPSLISSQWMNPPTTWMWRPLRLCPRCGACQASHPWVEKIIFTVFP